MVQYHCEWAKCYENYSITILSIDVLFIVAWYSTFIHSSRMIDMVGHKSVAKEMFKSVTHAGGFMFLFFVRYLPKLH